MAITDFSIFDEELGDCYKFSKQNLINLHFNNDNKVDDNIIYDKVVNNVNERFLKSVYLSFSNFDHVYYYDCTNKDIPQVEYPGILVLQSLDGLHRYEFELTDRVIIVLSNENGDKCEFTIESPGLYNVENGQPIKTDCPNVIDEIMRFKYEKSRIYLSPKLFSNEPHHTYDEILEELIKRRQNGGNKVFLTNLVKNIPNQTEDIKDDDIGKGAIINNENILENVQKNKVESNNTEVIETKTITSSIITNNENIIELGSEEGYTTNERTVITETVVTKKITRSVISETIEKSGNIENYEKIEEVENTVSTETNGTVNGSENNEIPKIDNSEQSSDNKENVEPKKCTCSDKCSNECTCVDNCSPECRECRPATQIIDEENDDKIHIFTTYSNIHYWGEGLNSSWPGFSTIEVEGQKWRELTIDATNCFIMGNFSGSEATPEISIEKPGKYYLENGKIHRA